MKWRLLLFSILGSVAWADQCQITSPLPVPVLLTGCTYSGFIGASGYPLLSSATFVAGTNVTITQSGSSITINSSASGGGGGASSLAASIGVVRSSPTSDLIAYEPFVGTVSGTTMTITLDQSSVTLQGNYYSFSALETATGTLTTNLNAIGTATGTIQTQVTLIAAATGQIAVSTGAIEVQVLNIGTATGTIQTQLTNVAAATGTLVTLTTQQTISGQKTFTSSETNTSANGLGVTYNINVGSMTGAGLTSCSAAGNAEGWNSATNLFTCQTGFLTANQSITLSGDSSGSGTTAITVTAAGNQPNITSIPTALTLGAASDKVTISSNAVMPGATAYYNAAVQITTANVIQELIIPNGSTKALLKQGDIYFDTNAGQLLAMDASTTNVVGVSTLSVTVSISSGSGWQNLDIPVWRAPTNAGVTVNKIIAESLPTGTTVLYQLSYQAVGSINTLGTSIFSVLFSTAVDDGLTTTSFNSNQIPAQDSVVLTTPNNSGSSAGKPFSYDIHYLLQAE